MLPDLVRKSSTLFEVDGKTGIEIISEHLWNYIDMGH
jgi:hypothetical protein